MKNSDLAKDYLKTAQLRLLALDLYFKNEGWSTVIREAQEAVELALKALLRIYQIEPPRIHDVSEVLQQNQAIFHKDIQANLDKLCDISRSLRRDRELAFYGSEDLTPSSFYKKKDAEQAMLQAKWLVETVAKQQL